MWLLQGRAVQPAVYASDNSPNKPGFSCAARIPVYKCAVGFEDCHVWRVTFTRHDRSGARMWTRVPSQVRGGCAQEGSIWASRLEQLKS